MKLDHMHTTFSLWFLSHGINILRLIHVTAGINILFFFLLNDISLQQSATVLKSIHLLTYIFIVPVLGYYK